MVCDVISVNKPQAQTQAQAQGTMPNMRGTSPRKRKAQAQVTALAHGSTQRAAAVTGIT